MMRTPSGRTVLLPILLMTTLAVCDDAPTGVEGTLPAADLKVLFVGNSLTYTNDLPAMVRTIAEATGHTMSYASVARPNYSLEDHWATGVQAAIAEAGADVVVMQQGPSSLPQNQVHLREWAGQLAPAIRDAGGRPALYMVWPDDSRTDFFDEVRDAYRGAAQAVDGLFAPAGMAWLEVWDRDPDIELYGPDGFHPSTLGTQVAALTLFRVLFDESVAGLPARLEPTTDGLPVLDLGGDADLIYEAVEAAVAGN